MPSVGTATALIVNQRIDAAIKKSFDPKIRESVYRILRLSSKGGDNTYIMILVYGIICTVMTIFSPYLMLAISLGLATISLVAWLKSRRAYARRELDILVKSNPAYWQPIMDKLQNIVLEAGKFKDGLLPTQTTKIVH